jgi:hypothetical protein
MGAGEAPPGAAAQGIMAGTFGCGGPRNLPAEEVRRIAGRDDEHYRQRMPGLGQEGPSIGEAGPHEGTAGQR